MTEETTNDGNEIKKPRKTLPKLKMLKSTSQQDEALGGDAGVSNAGGCAQTFDGSLCQTKANVGCMHLTDPC